MKKVNSLFRTIVTASALVFVSIASHAATLHLKADLKASSEVPAKDSTGTGTLTATLDTDTNEFKYHIEFSGLTGAVAAAHFHGPAAEGANAKPQLPIRPTCFMAIPSFAQDLGSIMERSNWAMRIVLL